MRGKEEVINDVLHDYNSQIKTWLKTRLNGAWDNGYCHGKEDALKEFLERPKPTTLADRIRVMSDEELAEWLDELVTHCNDGPCFNCFMQDACLTSMLDWLRKEVEE